MEASVARSRFRALLASELTSRPLEDLDYSGLLATSGIARRDADAVADEMFRSLADRFAQDGVITDKERESLKDLAQALKISPDRAGRIEAAAKTARYHQAVSDALADGTVTEEEARLLNRLQAQLGIREAAWTAGDLAPRHTSSDYQIRSRNQAGDPAPAPPTAAPKPQAPAGIPPVRPVRAPEPSAATTCRADRAGRPADKPPGPPFPHRETIEIAPHRGRRSPPHLRHPR